MNCKVKRIGDCSKRFSDLYTTRVTVGKRKIMDLMGAVTVEELVLMTGEGKDVLIYQKQTGLLTSLVKNEKREIFLPLTSGTLGLFSAFRSQVDTDILVLLFSTFFI